MCTPCAAKTSAVALPIPEAQPVIRMRLPVIEGIIWQAVSSRGQSPWAALGHILIRIIGDNGFAQEFSWWLCVLLVLDYFYIDTSSFSM